MKGVFVDDQDRSPAAMISTRGTLEFEYLAIETLTKLAARILAKAPHVVALDYRLDEEFNGIEPADGYKGSALAQHLRDRSIADPSSDFGIVLVSAEMKIRQVFEPDRTAHDLFDRVYSKEQIEKDRALVRSELVALGTAYEKLRSVEAQYSAADVLGVLPEEEDIVISQELRLPMESAAAPHLVVRQVLRTVILRPGLLLDDADAAAVLGIKPTGMTALAQILVDAGIGYRGLLAGGWRRWWAHRLEDWAMTVLSAQPTSLGASVRAEQLSTRFDLALEPAPSPWNGSTNELVAVACGSCRRPVEMRHTVAAFEPQLPRYSTRRRICWDCVQKDNYQPANMHVDDVDQDLIPMIKDAERK